MKKSKHMIIFLVVANVIFIAVYVFVFLKVSQFEMTAAKEYAKLGSSQENVGLYQSLAKNVKKSEVDRQKLENYFVRDSEIVGLIETLESFGGITGATVQIDSVSDSNPDYLAISITAEGDFREVYHVLALLENLPYKVSFSKVYFDESGKTTDQASTNLNQNPQKRGMVSLDLPGGEPDQETVSSTTSTTTSAFDDASGIPQEIIATTSQPLPHQPTPGVTWNLSVQFKILSFSHDE